MMHHNDTHEGDNDEVTSLFVAASGYATSALGSMIQRNASNPEILERIKSQYVDLAFGLQLEFVFPGLTGEERDALAGLLKAKNSLSVQFGGVRQWRTDSDRASHTEVTRNLKVEFLRQKTLIERLELEKQLDPLQRKILKNDFLAVPPDKSESTTFIRRSHDSGTMRSEEGEGTSDRSARGPSSVKNDNRFSSTEESRETDNRETATSPDADDTDTDHLPPARSLDRTEKTLLFVGVDLNQDQGPVSELADAGFHVHFTTNLKGALESAIDSPPDLVVLDLALSTGSESDAEPSGASRFLKGLSLLNDQGVPPIIGLCDDGSAAISQEADIAPALAATLRKPVSGRRLLGAICVALDDTCVESKPKRSLESGKAVTA
jgi:hypothetical protein